MKQDYDSSASGYIEDSFEGISRQFTDVEILTTSEVNIVARAKRYGRWWLLKGLNKNVADGVAYQQRLRKELELLMLLQHPNVVATNELEEVDGLGNCIVMEYVEGLTLKEWLKNKHSREERRRIAKQITEAVGYVHSRGVVHRDLKPQNIIITNNGESVKLIDFGLADTDSHTILKQPAGTMKYMSPEQLQTAVADVRNDIYSLGVIFSQMKIGYDAVIKKCLRPIEDRYQNVSELTDDIKRHGRNKARLIWGMLVMMILMLALLVLSQSIRFGEVMQNQTERQERVEVAIREGKDAIERETRTAVIMQHLDTLRSLRFLDMDIFNGINNSGPAANQYLESIRRNYSESEMEEITQALMTYNTVQLQKIMIQYNKLTQAYDKEFMQGD